MNYHNCSVLSQLRIIIRLRRSLCWRRIDQQKDYVVGHIETLNALSANNASFTEETSATSEEIDNAVKDSMEVLDTVMNHTHELLESVERFSV